jgi:hypothetical protein
LHKFLKIVSPNSGEKMVILTQNSYSMPKINHVIDFKEDFPFLATIDQKCRK